MKTTSENLIAVSVHPAVKEFILSTVGSEVIEPIPNSNFHYNLVSFMEPKKLKRTGKKYSFAKYETISINLAGIAIKSNTNLENLNGLIGEKVYEGFKNIYLPYMFAATSNGDLQHIDAIRDFCIVYRIEQSKNTLKTLENVWNHAKFKNSKVV